MDAQALNDQASTLALTSRAFHNNKLALFEKYITELFDYDKVGGEKVPRAPR